jgi:hypothetical protein
MSWDKVSLKTQGWRNSSWVAREPWVARARAFWALKQKLNPKESERMVLGTIASGGQQVWHQEALQPGQPGAD